MKNTKTKNKNILFWSPLLGHVGTLNAVIGMANALNNYKEYNIYLINLFGEFNIYKKKYPKFIYLDIFEFGKFFPTTGFFSKLFIHSFSIFSLPFIFYKVLKYRPYIIISSLVGYLPCIIKIFFNKIILVNTIQGLPRFTFLRKVLWKLFYNKSDYLFTMTKKTKLDISKYIGISGNKIHQVCNPIINKQIRVLALETLDRREEFLFKKKYTFCTVGRLTNQKNYFELLKGINKYYLNFNKNFNLLIIGSGELQDELKKYINYLNLNNNVHLLGFKKNPYKYIYRSNFYISTSKWEEPGHTLLEAGYLNIPIISSNCPNGPREILINNKNSFKYELGNLSDFLRKLNYALRCNNSKVNKIKSYMKKYVYNYTEFNFIRKFQKIIK